MSSDLSFDSCQNHFTHGGIEVFPDVKVSHLQSWNIVKTGSLISACSCLCEKDPTSSTADLPGPEHRGVLSVPVVVGWGEPSQVTHEDAGRSIAFL